MTIPVIFPYVVGFCRRVSTVFIVATPELLAIDPGPFLNGGVLRGFCTSVDQAYSYLSMGLLDDAPPADRVHRCRWVMPWNDVKELSAIEPWPSMRITWKAGIRSDTRVLTPKRKWFRSGPTAEEIQREEVLDALFDHIEVLGLDVPGDPGWTAVQHVPWEEVDDWPQAQTGTYRTAGVELIVASRSKPTSLEFLFAWWASGPRQPWKMTARDVVLTRHYIYAHLADDRKARLPLSALRDRWVSPRGDCIYEFGRRTRLVLPARDTCVVQHKLDELIGVV